MLNIFADFYEKSNGSGCHHMTVYLINIRGLANDSKDNNP